MTHRTIGSTLTSIGFVLVASSAWALEEQGPDSLAATADVDSSHPAAEQAEDDEPYRRPDWNDGGVTGEGPDLTRLVDDDDDDGDDEQQSTAWVAGAPVHAELTMGFVAAGQSHGDDSFAFQEGAGRGRLAAGLSLPFDGHPFDSVEAYGLRYDFRLVVSYVRMTVGVDLAMPAYRSSDTSATYEVDGEIREVVVQRLRPYLLHFGIGGELPLGPVSPFVDVLGTVHWVYADLTVDGDPAQFAATSFGFSVRAGLRAHVRRWFFISASGEVGLVGDVVWGAELSVGFAIG